MPVLTTGLVTHRAYIGSAEQIAGLPPAEDQKIDHVEINAFKNAIDNNATLLESIINIATAHIADASIHAQSSLVNTAYHAWVETQGADPSTIADWIRTFTENDLAALGAQLNSLREGGTAPTVRHTAGSVLILPVAPYHTQPHYLDTSGVATGTVAEGDYIKFILANPTAANQWVWIAVDGEKMAWIEGLIDGDATGVYINQDVSQADPTKRSVKLFSGDGASGWTLFA